jgi:hypothetical protein
MQAKKDRKGPRPPEESRSLKNKNKNHPTPSAEASSARQHVPTETFRSLQVRLTIFCLSGSPQKKPYLVAHKEVSERTDLDGLHHLQESIPPDRDLVFCHHLLELSDHEMSGFEIRFVSLGSVQCFH